MTQHSGHGMLTCCAMAPIHKAVFNPPDIDRCEGHTFRRKVALRSIAVLSTFGEQADGVRGDNVSTPSGSSVVDLSSSYIRCCTSRPAARIVGLCISFFLSMLIT